MKFSGEDLGLGWGPGLGRRGLAWTPLTAPHPGPQVQGTLGCAKIPRQDRARARAQPGLGRCSCLRTSELQEQRTWLRGYRPQRRPPPGVRESGPPAPCWKDEADGDSRAEGLRRTRARVQATPSQCLRGGTWRDGLACQHSSEPGEACRAPGAAGRQASPQRADADTKPALTRSVRGSAWSLVAGAWVPGAR